MKRNRAKQLSRKRATKAQRMKPGAQSNYARKRAWCDKHGVWGWEVPEPKPWRSSK
jgi:hypothetical protein